MRRRTIAAIIGAAYAAAYGFFTMLATGGGHGNFLWFIAFWITFCAGLFFPAAGFLVADLRPLWARVSLTVILFLNLFATLFLFVVFLGEEGWADIAESWERSPASFILLSVIHALPVVVLWIVDVRELSRRDSISGEYK